MKKKLPVLCALFLASAVMSFAANMGDDLYGSLHDFFSDMYGADENAGLTAFPVFTVPIGGRSEGMAGAFAAVCDDISFIEWNPAGSSGLVKTELAFFHNNWIADTKIESAIFATRLKNWGFATAGKWMYTPFTEYGAWGERLSKGYYSEASAILNVSYNLFPGYYFSGVSLGVNLKGGYRGTPDFSAYSSASQSAFAVAADFGALTRVNLLKFYESRDKNTSFAFVIKNAGPPVMGEAMPTLAVAAFSYRPVRPILISCDLSAPFNLADITISAKPYLAAGLSVTITRFLSMRGGFLLKAGSSRITLGSSIELGAAAIEINYSLDLATQIQPLNRVTIGVRLDMGDGGRQEIQQRVDEQYLAGLDAYSHGDDERALAHFKKALELNPHFDPAVEGVAAIDNFRALSNRIKSLESLDY